MLHNERLELIMQQLKLETTVKITSLSELLQVSVDTVRRDLRLMEQNGLLTIVRGGATLVKPFEALQNYKGREVMNSEEKRIIAKKALKLIRPGMIVGLNAGTTNAIIAQELINYKEKLTLVTNNLAAVGQLMNHQTIELILIGGLVDLTEQSTYSAVAEEELSKFFPDLCFLAMNAVNQTGFSDFRHFEIPMIQILARNSDMRCAVMDSTKLGRRSKKKILDLNQVDWLIMDDIPDALQEEYQDYGIKII